METAFGVSPWALWNLPCTYALLIEDMAVLDPGSPLIQTGRDGARANLLEIRGTTPAPYELQDIPHGAIQIVPYRSSTGLGDRRVIVYLPPGYDSRKSKRYPALYLLGGSGDTEMEWTSVGRAHWIADSLIHEGRARPMILVMPNGHPAPPGRARWGWSAREDRSRSVKPEFRS